MAGDWIKMEVSTPDKPEVFAITAKMGWDDPDLTVGKLFRVWRWFDQQTVDGNARGVTAALLDRIAGVTGFANAMKSVGWLTENEGGLSLPNFEKHCGKTAKKRAQTANRVAEHRANAGSSCSNAGGNAPSVTSALAREEKRREEEKPMSGKPDPDSPQGLLAYLNAKTGRRYRPVDTNLALIRDRLKTATPDEIRAVIDSQCAKWGNNPDMAEYLRPETLFRARKFESYIGNVGAARSVERTWEGAL